ncbi:MAG: hypothetical protein RSB08_02350, partial [Clostridia bacterium]
MDFGQKVIIKSVISMLNLYGDDVLEVSNNGILATNGIWDGLNCQICAVIDNKRTCKYLCGNNANARITYFSGELSFLIGGQYDIVFLFNYIDETNLLMLLNQSFVHLADDGRIVVLNTDKVISEKSVKKLNISYKYTAT